MYAASSSTSRHSLLSQPRHQEFMTADDVVMEPLELCATEEEEPSLILGDQDQSYGIMACYHREIEEQLLMDNPYPLSVDNDHLFDGHDDLSTSAQPGGGINNDPPEKLVHHRDVDRPDYSSQATRNELLLLADGDPLRTRAQMNHPCHADSHSYSELASIAEPSEPHLSPKSYQMSPSTPTESTVSCCTCSSSHHHQCYSSGTISWAEWNDLIAAQLSPWCDLLEASKEEESELMGLVKSQFMQAFPRMESHVQRAAALAFLQGLSLQQQRHAIKVEEMQEQQRQQLAMLQPETSQHQEDDAAKKPKSLRFRYGTHVASDNHTVASAWSTMSCRELSIERYQRCRRGKRKGSDNLNQAHDKQNTEVQRLLKELQEAERKQKRLEQQLQQAGIVLAEDIPYQEAKDRVEQISKRMNEIGSSDVHHEDPQIQKALQAEYFRLEQDMDKYMNALLLTDEYIAEQKALEDAWEEANKADNLLALKQVRRHMPVDIRKLTKQQLLQLDMPADMIKKIQRTNVLQLLRRDPIQSIARWHPSMLEALRVSGLTLTERRALHQHLLPALEVWESMNDPLTERKRTWLCTMRSNFKESLVKYARHLDETDGMAGSDHQCTLLGRQCPVRANMTIDYSGDGLGFPEGNVYEESVVLFSENGSSCADSRATCDTEAQTMVQRRSEVRLEGLRKHYKDNPNKVQEVALALNVCEAMDILMDRMETQEERWILQSFQSSTTSAMNDGELALAGQLLADLKRELSSWTLRSGGEAASAATIGEVARDPRSLIEVSLIEEVYETASDYIAELKKRLLALESSDSSPRRRLEQMLDQLEPLLEMSHRSILLLLRQNVEKMPKTRKRKSRTELMASMWTKDCSSSDSWGSSCNTSKRSSSQRSQHLLSPQEAESRTINEEDRRQGSASMSALAKEIAGRRVSKLQPKAPMGLLEAISARRAEV